MSTLSERLLALMVDMEGECCPACDEWNAKTLGGAAAIVKRYEEAPVATFGWDWLSERYVVGEVKAENPSPEELERFERIQEGQRVRLVVEENRNASS